VRIAPLVLLGAHGGVGPAHPDGLVRGRRSYFSPLARR
jgi:hypothetical protein